MKVISYKIFRSFDYQVHINGFNFAEKAHIKFNAWEKKELQWEKSLIFSKERSFFSQSVNFFKHEQPVEIKRNVLFMKWTRSKEVALNAEHFFDILGCLDLFFLSVFREIWTFEKWVNFFRFLKKELDIFFIFKCSLLLRYWSEKKS